ncbi:hypothetical protein UCDDA912_g06805 [Diaporthe ampelina]|uniref:Uncharacterized protein n=1 Tax=Diaporthe ampelina TaxID=1214573 RepID=A0A0G2FGE2_9PEZI|nr:hypothetical protein UCDDA912_g06805 [Diaporthe ampelina]
MADPPMVLPLLDDGTLENDPELDDQGFYHFDWNVTSVKTADPPAEAIRHMNCRNAQIAVNRTYQVSCESNQNDGSPYLDYYIAITGTGAEGYHAVGWCKGIIDNIHRYCGWNFNLVGDITCGTSNATLVTFFMDTSIRGDHVNQVQGTELYFSLRKPWDSSDNNHECIAKAIQRGSCASGGMMPTYPVVCRSKDWFDLELTEWSWGNLGSV